MVIRLMQTVFFFVLIIAFGFGANASLIQSNVDGKTEFNPTSINSAVLRCFVDEVLNKRSVVTVLGIEDTDSIFKKYDVGITTGHGIVGKDGASLETCFVYGPDGRQRKVKIKRLAPDYQDGTASDWAILIFEKIKDENFVRYEVDPNLSLNSFELLGNERALVQFSTARGLMQNGQSCHLYPRQIASMRDDKYKGMLPHSCKAIAGQSGSPVSIGLDGMNVLIGIHLGQSFSLPIKDISDRAQWYGFMRIVDTAFLITFSEMLSDLKSEL